MRDDERWIGLIMMDQLEKAAIVGLHIALSSPHSLTLEPEFSEVKGDLALFGERVLGTRILRYEDAYDTEAAGSFDAIKERVHDEIGYFLASGVVTLVADTFRTAVRPESIGQVADLLPNLSILGIDR